MCQDDSVWDHLRPSDGDIGRPAPSSYITSCLVLHASLHASFSYDNAAADDYAWWTTRRMATNYQRRAGGRRLGGAGRHGRVIAALDMVGVSVTCHAHHRGWPLGRHHTSCPHATRPLSTLILVENSLFYATRPPGKVDPRPRFWQKGTNHDD